MVRREISNLKYNLFRIIKSSSILKKSINNIIDSQCLFGETFKVINTNGSWSFGISEVDKHAVELYNKNFPSIKNFGDITKINAEDIPKHDLLVGGFPCQAFSYAGKKLGFNDTRGTLFYEFARAVKETNPKLILAENVKGLVSHESGKTLQTIKEVIDEIGYELVEPEVLKAIFYRVPQKRERIFLVAIRKDFSRFVQYRYPSKFPEIFTMRDALQKGRLFKTDVPESEGQVYPKRKRERKKNA